jgi:hypothetical protein
LGLFNLLINFASHEKRLTISCFDLLKLDLLIPTQTFQAGFSYAYNARLYNLTYFPDFDVGTWLSLVSIFGGSFGVVLGGVISDAIVVRIGVHARLWLLGAFMVI